MMAVSVLMVSVALLLSVSEVISQCPPSSSKHWMCIITTAFVFIGIYLMHNGSCYSNGSYFFDDDLQHSNSLNCVLPGSTLNGGEWVTPSGPSVDCSTNPLRCNLVSSPNATISLYIIGEISPSNDGWYKCCLPTTCSDPNTNIIFANIFSKSFHYTCNHLLLIV